jgi:SMP-30/gluconolaconase/LRE-like protein
MKTKPTETKFKCAFGRVRQLFSRVAWLGAVILICSSASAQNLFVSGKKIAANEGSGEGYGAIFKFTWDRGQSVYASELYKPGDLALDSAGNLFFMDYVIFKGESGSDAAVFKITPNRPPIIFAFGLNYSSSLAVDKTTGKLFVADYGSGIIYQYKPNGLRAKFASGLCHPSGMAFDNAGNLWVVDNSIGNIYQGGIYEYKPNGKRVTFAALDPSDRPTGLAFDSMGNLYMADLGGKIYKYDLSAVLRPQGRTTFGSVPNSAQSLTFDGAGNLFVVDAGDTSGKGNAVYQFTLKGKRSTFASGQASSETFSHIALQPMPVCCQ